MQTKLNKRLKNLSEVTISDIENAIRAVDGARCVFDLSNILRQLGEPEYEKTYLKALSVRGFVITRTKYKPKNPNYPIFIHYEIQSKVKA